MGTSTSVSVMSRQRQASWSANSVLSKRRVMAWPVRTQRNRPMTGAPIK